MITIFFFLEINIRWNSEIKLERKEIFNFKNDKEFRKFQENTENNDVLLKCLQGFSDFYSACNKWLKTFNDIVRKSFRKIRITGSKNPVQLNLLFQKKELMKQKMDKAVKNKNLEVLFELEEKYDAIFNEIATFCVKKNVDIVKKYLGKEDGLEEDEPHNQLKTWKLKKKLAPKNSQEAPSAKVNADGELVTEKDELEKLYLNTYIERLKPNPTPDELKDVVNLKNLLFDLRLKMSSQHISSE